MGKMKEHSLRLWGRTLLSSQLGTMWSYVGLTGRVHPRGLNGTGVGCQTPPGWGVAAALRSRQWLQRGGRDAAGLCVNHWGVWVWDLPPPPSHTPSLPLKGFIIQPADAR